MMILTHVWQICIILCASVSVFVITHYHESGLRDAEYEDLPDVLIIIRSEVGVVDSAFDVQMKMSYLLGNVESQTYPKEKTNVLIYVGQEFKYRFILLDIVQKWTKVNAAKFANVLVVERSNFATPASFTDRKFIVWFVEYGAFPCNRHVLENYVNMLSQGDDLTVYEHYIVAPQLTSIDEKFTNFELITSSNTVPDTHDDGIPDSCALAYTISHSFFTAINRMVDSSFADIISLRTFNDRTPVVCGANAGYVDGNASIADILVDSATMFDRQNWDNIFSHVSNWKARIRPSASIRVDETYVVNLERRRVRWQRTRDAVSLLGLDVSFTKAIDGREIDDDTIHNLGISFLPSFLDPYQKRAMTMGEIGCFLSHYNLWKRAVQLSQERIMILEDDARFVVNFTAHLNATLNSLDKNGVPWDLLYVGRKIMTHETESLVVLDRDVSVVKPSYTYWTVGYILTLKGAQKLLAANPLQNLLPVDEFLPIMFGEHPNKEWSLPFKTADKLDVFSVHPRLIFPSLYPNEIGHISDTEDSKIVTKPTNI